MTGPWHVCCRACRTGGHRDGCERCEERTRETFSQPHPDDFPGGLPLPGEYPTLSGLLSDSPCGTHPKYIA